jgi:hypothetical protein
LAARKRLEELTPMKVAYHAPPLVEQAPAERAPEATTPSEAGTLIETAEPETRIEQPVTKPRKRRAPAAEPSQETAETPANGAPATPSRRRRAAATAEPSQETAETPANGAPAVKTRKRRATTADAERNDETEPVTTEKAS